MNNPKGLLLAVAVAAMAFTLSCEAKDTQATFTDSRDGKSYKKVKIGEQVWMAENLNFDAEGGKCYGEGGQVVTGYENDAITTTLSPSEVQANCEKYGRLYDWNTAVKVCPKGWHLPTKADWEILTKTVGGEQTEGKKLKAASGWNENGNGTDEFGFSALPGGDGYSVGSFGYVGDVGGWWSASENENKSNEAYFRYMGYNYEFARWGDDHKSHLFSVRCVKDN